MSRDAETVSSRQTPAEAGQLMPIQTNPAATRIIAMKDAATKDTVASAVSSAARSSAAVASSSSLLAKRPTAASDALVEP